MALRVLPSLSRAVTAPEVRRRKRLVMLLPGLVAFVLYRLVKPVLPLSDIWMLLSFSGLISAATAWVAYAAGRRRASYALVREDGVGRIGWVVGWIGCVYGVQLSLMVLALLSVVVQYDFLRHPDGPAMMAIIIACTSVARDAFEIGHLRRLQHEGQPIVTFPEGAGLRTWVRSEPAVVVHPALAAALTALCAWGAGAISLAAASALGQLIIVTALSGTLALAVYLAAVRPGGGLWSSAPYRWTELFRFWWWPGLAFAATYALTLQGVVLFVMGKDLQGGLTRAVLAGCVGGGMALYCAYLGRRRALEDRIQDRVPSSLLRCPFVFDILTKRSPRPADPLAAPAIAGEGRRS